MTSRRPPDRTGCFNQVQRIALNAHQVVEYGLPPQPGKATDSRAPGFVARHGALVQVELDALPPELLRELYQEAIDAFWDMSVFNEVVGREQAERALLSA